MSLDPLCLAMRRAARDGDWIRAERIGRRLGWWMMAGALRDAMARLLAPHGRRRPR